MWLARLPDRQEKKITTFVILIMKHFDVHFHCAQPTGRRRLDWFWMCVYMIGKCDALIVFFSGKYFMMVSAGGT